MVAVNRGSLFCQNKVELYPEFTSVIGKPLFIPYACTRFQVGWLEQLPADVSEYGRFLLYTSMCRKPGWYYRRSVMNQLIKGY